MLREAVPELGVPLGSGSHTVSATKPGGYQAGSPSLPLVSSLRVSTRVPHNSPHLSSCQTASDPLAF